MPLDLNAMDPAEAWRPYQPSEQVPWIRARAAHLFRRAGFSATPTELDAAVADGPDAAVDRLLAPSPEAISFSAAADQVAAAAVASGIDRMAAAWLYRMLETPDPLREKLVLFWHGHFATSNAKVRDPELMLLQNNLFRERATGDFEPLVQDVSRDPAMLIFLDSESNRKAHPNENYARELMELFCLGEGNYTEQDVQEVARCFTGWEVRRDRFRFNRFEHDSGEKSFLGSTGSFGGEEAVRIVLEQPQAATFLARKLFRYFVCDEPAAPDSLIEPLADRFRDSGLDVSVLVRQILGSELFFSDAAVGRKVRSPVEFAVGLLRAFQGSANMNTLARGVAELGQALYAPPNVKGWDGGRTWIDSSTLLGRANLTRRLLDSGDTRFGGGNLSDQLDRDGFGRRPESIVDGLAELLLAVPLSPPVRSRLIDVAGSRDGDRERQARNTLYALCTLPEFQLS